MDFVAKKYTIQANNLCIKNYLCRTSVQNDILQAGISREFTHVHVSPAIIATDWGIVHGAGKVALWVGLC